MRSESDPTTEGTGVPSLQDFAAECRAFLAERHPRKVAAERKAFVWGEGSDRVAVFEEADREVEAAHVAAVRQWRRALWEHGLGWISGPTELGGRGLTRAHQQVFDTEMRAFDVPGNGPLTITLGMIVPTILAHGTPEAKAKYLPALHNGDLIACQLFSEPDAGSDLASLGTTAVRDGDTWRITGQKVWTSGAHFSDIGEIICRTEQGPRHRNLTAFVVDMHAPGVEVRPLRQMTGGASFNEVFLDDVVVHDVDRLGDVNEGWRVALTTLANERNAIGGDGFGGTGLLSFERYIAMARHFGVAESPVTRQQLIDLFANLRMAQYTNKRAAANRRKGGAPGPEGSIGKLVLAQNFQRISALVSHVLGQRLVADSGEWGTYAWTDVVLGTPGYRVGGGTDEVMRNILAERVLGLPKDPMEPGSRS